MSQSELRQDLVSGDWIVIARRRRKLLLKKLFKRRKTAKTGCVFEKLSPENGPILVLPSLKPNQKPDGNWRVAIIPNRYPAFTRGNACPTAGFKGPFRVMGGIGHSDVLITRDHDDNFPDLKKQERETVFETMRDRYLMLFGDPCVAYVSIFQNWGRSAGASVYHPHYQIMGIPVIPPNVAHSLTGSRRFFEENKKCVHCEIIAWEKKSKSRLVYENSGAVAFAPFASREPFEVRIFPKKHLPYFENTLDVDLACAAEALAAVLRKMKSKLKDPDYNFFIHTAPVKNKSRYSHYHWHIEVLPKMKIAAGFELGTGIDINIVSPEEAADILRK